MDPVVIGLISTIVSIWLGSVEFRMRNLDQRLRDTPSKDEVSEEIKVRQEPIKVLQHEIKEDIKEIKEMLRRQ